MDQIFDTYGPTLFPVCIFGSMLGMFALALVINYRQKQTLREAWEGVAMRTGLMVEPGNFFTMPTLSGEYRRRALVMNIFARGSSKNRVLYTRVTLAVSNNRGGRMGLTPEGILSGLGRMFGMQDIPLGSERFDKSFMVRSDPPEFASTIIGDPMLQDSLLRLRERSGFELSLDGGSLIYVVRGTMKDPDAVVEVFNTLSDLADKVEGGIRSSF